MYPNHSFFSFFFLKLTIFHWLFKFYMFKFVHFFYFKENKLNKKKISTEYSVLCTTMTENYVPAFWRRLVGQQNRSCDATWLMTLAVHT